MKKKIAKINDSHLKILAIVRQLARGANPSECSHDHNGHHLLMINKIGGDEFDKYLVDTGFSPDEIIAIDEQMRKQGYYLSGGCLSCSKCGQPFRPPISDIAAQ